MEQSKFFSIEVFGEHAMFTTPISKKSCERTSYPMPTYSALCGIMNNVYYRPGIKWVVDKCRVLNQIEYEDMGIISPVTLYSKHLPRRRYEYMYLRKPRYQIEAHYVRDYRFYGKPDCHLGHDDRIERAIAVGGDSTLKLGTGNCFAFMTSCQFGQGEGYYDDDEEGIEEYMFHSFQWNKKTNEIEWAGFAIQKMEYGVIDFGKIRPIFRRW